MKRMVRIFFMAWAGVFMLSFFTGSSSITFVQRLAFSAVLALGVPVLLSGKGKEKKHSEKGRHVSSLDVDIHRPLDPKVLYRVRNGKIYREMDVAPIYEIKGNKIHPVFSAKVAYRIEKGKIYRGMEPAPILEIKNQKIYRIFSSRVEYEIRAPKGL